MSENIVVPDIGGAEGVDVIEIAVKPGDQIAVDDTLLTLESDKATMDIPSPSAGTVKSIKIKVGDKVSEGDVILLVDADGAKDKASEVEVPKESAAEELKEPAKAVPVKDEPKSTAQASALASGAVHAGPAVRRLASELGVELSNITATGRKGRVLLEDVHGFVKGALQSGGAAGSGLSVLAAPKVDYAKYGEIEKKSLSRIQKISGANLHRNWVTIPHITQFDEADITDMEAFRQAQKKMVEQAGAKLTPLVFVMKAVVTALKAYPQFNASLDSDGESLVLKKYFHIGVAVDTPNGLVVPVIRDVDQKGLIDLSLELGALSKKAREGKLLPTEMQGGCFTISSLGGIGGTAFTPIVNMPEVAILGVSRSEIKPKFIEGEFQPRLMLPLSLSYDHRVIDGADGARFATCLSRGLSDLRTLML